MKIVFASNNYNHHEHFFCKELNSIPDVEFYFIQTQPMQQERIKLGWGLDISQFPYVIESYASPSAHNKAIQLCNDADALILGAAPNEFIAERVRKNRLTFFYAERLFRNGIWHMLYPPTFFTVLKRFIHPGRHSNFYLLCASAYTAWDTSRIFAFSNRRFKWGHFIDVSFPEKRKNRVADGKIHLLWVGRFLELKHPDYAIRIARTLHQQSIPFILDVIGTGDLADKLKMMIRDFYLSDHVIMHGPMAPTQVREYMQKADIYMFTSDFNEGWGAVLGESMTSGCAVVTSHATGATPFLVKHRYNGLIYESGNYESFERNVLELVASEKLRGELSNNAINTMLKVWNPSVAATRFHAIVKQIIETGSHNYYDFGPMSKADILKNDWFEDDTI